MNINELVINLKELIVNIDKVSKWIGESRRTSGEPLDGLIASLETIVPLWFGVIQQYELGTVDDINYIISDIAQGMTSEDVVLLQDALINGLQDLARQYLDALVGAYEE